mgnify:CR=1 FL=1
MELFSFQYLVIFHEWNIFGRAPDVRVIVQMKEKILGLITNIHYEIQSDFHL